MTEATVAPSTEVTDLVPAKIGGVIVPKTIEALEKLLDSTKNQAWPLAFRANVLPEPVRFLLYSLGGIPEAMPANYVGFFAGRPYVYADGAIDLAISQGCDLFTEPKLFVVPCLDPSGGCPGEMTVKRGDKKVVVKATEEDYGYIATARLKTPAQGHFTTYAQCCMHTWRGEAKHRPEMARTRALRKAAIRALSIPQSSIRSEDEPDVIEGEFTVDVPAPSAVGDTEPAESKPSSGSVSDGNGDPDQGSATGAETHPDSVVIGPFTIEPAPGGPHSPAEMGDGFSEAQKVFIDKILDRNDLVESAKDSICKKRFGVAWGQASRQTAEELSLYLQALERGIQQTAATA